MILHPSFLRLEPHVEAPARSAGEEPLEAGHGARPAGHSHCEPRPRGGVAALDGDVGEGDRERLVRSEVPLQGERHVRLPARRVAVALRNAGQDAVHVPGLRGLHGTVQTVENRIARRAGARGDEEN